ncbi:unnamed protein product [Clavelina lepadiformis]|uniref:Uncharacterized protein n=1 Tax=Clavelina lepadiformis TaxID=159417 RepID=A0ABP0F1E2_CLALP
MAGELNTFGLSTSTVTVATTTSFLLFSAGQAGGRKRSIASDLNVKAPDDQTTSLEISEVSTL